MRGKDVNVGETYEIFKQPNWGMGTWTGKSHSNGASSNYKKLPAAALWRSDQPEKGTIISCVQKTGASSYFRVEKFADGSIPTEDYGIYCRSHGCLRPIAGGLARNPRQHRLANAKNKIVSKTSELATLRQSILQMHKAHRAAREYIKKLNMEVDKFGNL
jgi:hypothetical protein